MKNHKISFLDKPRSLRFDVNAMSDAEELLQNSVFSVLSDPNALLQFRVQRILWWAGLKHEDPTMTLVKAGLLLQQAIEDGADLAVTSSALNQALAATGLFKLKSQTDETGETEGSKQPPQSVEV